MVLRISIGLKSCCIGNGGTAGEFESISQVIFINHPIHHRLTEKIGQPLITLRAARLFGNLEKCTFCTDRVSFLGYVVTAQGIEVDPAKIEAISSWPTPLTAFYGT